MGIVYITCCAQRGPQTAWKLPNWCGEHISLWHAILTGQENGMSAYVVFGPPPATGQGCREDPLPEIQKKGMVYKVPTEIHWAVVGWLLWMIKHVNKSLVNSIPRLPIRVSSGIQAVRTRWKGSTDKGTRHVLLIAVEFATVRMKALMSSYVPVVTRNEKQAGGVGQSVCSMSERAELVCSGLFAP